ncbi:NAD(P)(+) transhydrogenase (Re/Si-specific) subunit alpha, partial [Mycobacterium tuberculosis]|nr:NAD(P)(+) transhydrogenase (Re/Si-specific) subunit alpha [Mycobacterium tuberculosis]
LEGRVAATPETVKKLKSLGFDVFVEAGAGEKSRITDADFAAAGATVANGPELMAGATVVLTVRRPAPELLAGAAPEALVIG